jgi:uncharacterized protein (UPF0333 family)
MNKKGQAATEYLIVLAVVVIIALIVVAITGGIPGIGKGAAGRTSAAYWATQDVAITSFAISAAGDDIVTVKNNAREAITITALTVNSIALEPATSILGLGGTKSYTGAVAACTAGQGYSYPVVITYTNSKTGASTTLSGDGAMLEGTCAA